MNGGRARGGSVVGGLFRTGRRRIDGAPWCFGYSSVVDYIDESLVVSICSREHYVSFIMV